jgi:4-amino-4-deoxy-L-arabinose transferase-like glycosyltransferase
MNETLIRARGALSGFADALADPARRTRAVLVLLLAYAILWTLYGIVAKSSQDINADMAEMVVWSRNAAWGYPKHPPFLAWVLTLWFRIFPLAGWAYTLLAVLNCTLGLWLAYVLAGEWLDGPKRAAAPLLLALIPFYNFLGLKFDQNSALIPLWALTTLAFVRSLDRGSLGWAALAGLAGAAAMLSKYWSAFFLLALMIAVLFDRRRNDYFRSPAPYVTAAVAILAFLPHAVWLVQHDFPPLHWVANRRAAHSVLGWLNALAEYSFGTIGYCSVAIAACALASRPSRAALRDTLWPGEGARRRAALVFWSPLLVPIAVAAILRTNLLSLWNAPALTLLPVVLLSSPAVTLTRAALARLAAAALAVPLAALLASPVVAYVILKNGVENDAAYARLVMAQMQRQWRAATPAPLTLIAGPFGLVSSAAFYGADRPSTFADFSHYLSPGVTPETIARQGLAIACPADDAGCLHNMAALTATAADSSRSEVTLQRHWLGFAGPPERFTIAIVPPR